MTKSASVQATKEAAGMITLFPTHFLPLPFHLLYIDSDQNTRVRVLWLKIKKSETHSMCVSCHNGLEAIGGFSSVFYLHSRSSSSQKKTRRNTRPRLSFCYFYCACVCSILVDSLTLSSLSQFLFLCDPAYDSCM